MDRRRFLAAVAASAAGGARTAPAAEKKPALLLPTDEPDELGFRIMWYSPVPPLDPATYHLKVGGLVEKQIGRAHV